MSIFIGAIPLLLAFGPLVVIIIGIHLWKKRSVAFRKNNPLNKDLLRSPGETLRIEIEELNLDLMSHLTTVITMPLLLYSTLLSIQLWGDKDSIGVGMIVFYVLAGLVAIGFVAHKLVNTLKRRRKLTIGLEAEIAVGQALNELMREGAYVFHDLPADGFNIDHVVVSAKGVLAIETKGRTKPVDGTGKTSGWNVSYDGTTLAFPGWTETAPLEQATRQAKWLQEWLSSAVGEAINTKPVLVLPRWFVKREENAKGMFVFNGKNPQMLLQYGQDVLTPTLIGRIVHQLDQRCRNIKPT